MIATSFYLDTRNVPEGKTAPIKIRMTFKKKTLLINLGIRVLPIQWDAASSRVINHPRKKGLNDFMLIRQTQINSDLMELETSGELKTIEPTELKARLEGKVTPVDTSKNGEFLRKYLSFSASRNTPGTRAAYHSTLVRLQAFDAELEKRSFEDIDKDYLIRFDAFLALTNCRNSRNVHYRNIRAVFNDAIDDELTTCYPFRKFKLKTEPTRKRSLSVRQLRTLRDYPLTAEKSVYRDIFMLMFYLIGVNAVDLLNAPKGALTNGRLEYIRSKTHKSYSIKVEPEAMRLIEKYAGTEHLLFVMDSCSSYKDWLHRMGDNLKTIGTSSRPGHAAGKNEVPLFPGISQYWCRHTWATIAAELDIPKETIAAGLGHEMGCPTTSIYINYDYKKVDAANRRIIDYVNSEEEL